MFRKRTQPPSPPHPQNEGETQPTSAMIVPRSSSTISSRPSCKTIMITLLIVGTVVYLTATPVPTNIVISTSTNFTHTPLIVHTKAVPLPNETILSSDPVASPIRNQTVAPLKSTLLKTMTSSATVKPWDSIPPTPIALGSFDNPAIQQRHHCLKEVRKLQEKLLGPSIVSHADVLFVDPAYHPNVGDHMLTLGVMTFMERSMKHAPAIQCHYVQSGNFYPDCNVVIQQASMNSSGFHTGNNRVALWHAGGNWGDLWRRVQDARIKSFEILLQNKFQIVSMPQSLYYEKKLLKEKDVGAIKTQIAKGLGFPNRTHLESPQGQELVQTWVTFAWREKTSYEEAKVLYPFANNMLIPDIALQLGPFAAHPSVSEMSVDILLFLRGDKESTIAKKRNREYIQNAIPSKNATFHIVDWADRLSIFSSCDFFFTETSIQLLSLGKVVICDRLHAAILCYLSGIPFVYIDQVSGKITKTLEGAFHEIPGCLDGDKAMWAKSTSLEDALTKACTLITDKLSKK